MTVKAGSCRRGFDIGNYINEEAVAKGVRLGTLRIPGRNRFPG